MTSRAAAALPAAAWTAAVLAVLAAASPTAAAGVGPASAQATTTAPAAAQGTTAAPAAAQVPGAPAAAAAPGPASADDARSSVQRAVRWLLEKQNPDGSWGTSTVESLFELQYSNASFHAWKVAGGALSFMALRVVDETPERRAALEKALSYLCSQDPPKRGNDWDIDSNWTALYAFVALVDAARDPRFAGEPWKTRIAERGRDYYRVLEATQEPLGGWGYYEGPVVSRRPTWSTSFATACVIPALVAARDELGWPVDAKVVERAVKYVDRCRLPNGAVSYDLDAIPRIDGGENINQVKGSLGRIQVANWALRRAGVPSVTDERIRWGVEQFFENHRFLDAARLKPVPHESWYANAGYYYFFGHYHAALAIQELPEAERAALHARLRGHLV